MPKTTITRGSTQQLTPHFRESEFYTTSRPGPISHSFYTELIEAAEYLRSHYGVAWRITSTYRTPAHELKICRSMGKGEEYAQALSKTSQHVAGRAFDSQPISNHSEIVADLAWQVINRGPVFEKLLRLGITGFGLYDWGIHLDCRLNPSEKAGGLKYSFWDERETIEAKKKAPTRTKPNPTKTPALLTASPNG